MNDWATRRRILPQGVTAKPGIYSLDTTPYAEEPQDAFFDPEVQVTVLCWASRLGKTETLMNLTGYTIDHDPANMLWVYPTLDGGKKWRKQFVNPMINACPCLRKKVRPMRSRDADNTMLSFGFPGGRVSCIGANSPSAFRQVQAPRVICDEIDAMENGIEGDPVTLAFKRADNYSDSVKVVSSTPTRHGQSRIQSWLLQSDYRKRFCPCPHCGHEQVWMWSHMRFDKAHLEDAHLECENCKGAINDEQRMASVRAGRWKPTQPFNGIRGYWLNGLVSLFAPTKGFKTKLQQFAADFLQANEQGPDQLRTFTNTFFCEWWIEEDSTPQAIDVLERAEPYTPETLPQGVLALTAAGDCQDDRIEVEVTGWGKDEERWGVEKKVIYGRIDQDEVWQQLDRYLLTGSTDDGRPRPFMREDGVPLEIERFFIDMGHRQDRVLAFCQPRAVRGVFPCKGLNIARPNPPPLLPSRPNRNNKTRTAHWMVGVTVAKNAIYSRLALPTPGPRSFHFPKDADSNNFGYDPDHFRQLTSEKRYTKYSHGQAYYLFDKPHSSTRNEALDLAVYNLAALHSLMPINWTRLAENRLAQRPVEMVEPQDTAPVAQRPRIIPRRPNFATNF